MYDARWICRERHLRVFGKVDLAAREVADKNIEGRPGDISIISQAASVHGQFGREQLGSVVRRTLECFPRRT